MNPLKTNPPVAPTTPASPPEVRVHAIIDRVRPYIQSHGGDVTVAHIADGAVTLKIAGSCAHCPLATLTYNKVVKTLLEEEVPEITRIILT